MEEMLPSTEDGRVTLAVVQRDILGLQSQVSGLSNQLGELRTVMEERVRRIEVNTLRGDRLERDVDELCDRMEIVEKEMGYMRPAVKVLIWIGSAMGVLIIGFLFGILTGSVQVIVP